MVPYLCTVLFNRTPKKPNNNKNNNNNTTTLLQVKVNKLCLCLVKYEYTSKFVTKIFGIISRNIPFIILNIKIPVRNCFTVSNFIILYLLNRISMSIKILKTQNTKYFLLRFNQTDQIAFTITCPCYTTIQLCIVYGCTKA